MTNEFMVGCAVATLTELTISPTIGPWPQPAKAIFTIANFTIWNAREWCTGIAVD